MLFTSAASDKAHSTPLVSFVIFSFVMAAVLCLLPVGAAAQTQSGGPTDHGVTAGFASAHRGAYPIGVDDTVNYYSGRVSLNLPLGNISGRGGVGYQPTVSISRTFVMRHYQYWAPAGTGGTSWSQPIFKFISEGYNDSYDYSNVQAGLGPGVMIGRKMRDHNPNLSQGNPTDCTALTKLFLRISGGEVEFRDAGTNGNPNHDDGFHPLNRGRVWRTVDGSAMTFVSDADISDETCGDRNFPAMNGINIIRPSGYLMMKDGTHFRFVGGVASWMRDRNGNTITFDAPNSVVDSAGRTYQVSDTGVTYKGGDGTDRTVAVINGSLSTALRSDFAAAGVKSQQALFPSIGGSLESPTSVFDPVVLKVVRLPNNLEYHFYYDAYGQLSRVELPAGGSIEYDYNDTLQLGGSDSPQFIKQVKERRVFDAPGHLQSRQTFEYDIVFINNSIHTVSTVTTYDYTDNPNGVIVGKGRHTFKGSVASDAQFTGWYQAYDNGREVKSEVLDAAGQPLRRVEKTWEPRPGLECALTATQTRLLDTNQVSKTTYAYDSYGNVTDTYEYDFGSGSPPQYATRHAHTDYVPDASYVNANFDPTLGPTGTSLRSLPRVGLLYAVNPLTGVETVVAKSERRYDEPVYPLFTYGGMTVPGWAAPATSARGNATSIRSFVNAAVVVAPDQPCPVGVCVESHARYDQFGNVRRTWDANGNESNIYYDDSFADGNNSRSTFAFPTRTESSVPDPTHTFGTNTSLVATSVYNFNTGQVTSATDVSNNNTTTYEYSDPLDRLTQVNLPDGGRTTRVHMDTHQWGPYVETKTLLDTSGREATTRQFFDGLGRPYRSFTWEDQDASNPWLTVDTFYDGLGRVRKVSKPYRSTGPGGEPDENRAGAEVTFDVLGRVRQMKTTADGAVVKTDYIGDRVLVTDQDGKQRISQTDAFGRLRAVWEVTPNDQTRYPGVESIPSAVTAGLPASGYGYGTEYFYDAPGNLRRVKQGTQQRFFAYDSLGRLVRAKNPEQGAFNVDGDFPELIDGTSGESNGQWSMGYVYDASGNLVKRKDARNIITTYTYDALNRNTTTSYANDPAQTPVAYRHYDGAIGGLGRLWYSSAGATATGINEYDALGRVREHHQNFLVGTQWSQPYSVKLEYNKGGGLTSMIYPSTHKVEYQYDAAGRLGDNGGLPAFKGTLGDGAPRTYTSQVLYTEMGGMSQERFGTQTPVYNKRFYNVRGQLAEMRVSTYSITNTDPNLKTNWNRGAIINHYSTSGWGATGGGDDNNGNLKKQDVFIPRIDGAGYDQGGNFDLFTQDYDYDALNRLRGVTEGGRWRQQYDYDRWGNRTLNAAATQVYEEHAPYSIPKPQFAVDTATNRLGVPTGRSEQMDYDAAGNLILDTYQGEQGGGGTRTYDAENRMTSAQFVAGQTQTASYVYDADGRRVKRGVGSSAEVWQVYGVGGELLAEYAPQAAPNQPRKEYGYRGGELLVTAEPGAAQQQQTPPQQRANVALASAGATAAASSQYSASYPAASAINGDRYHLNAAGGVYNEWHSAAGASKPDWLEVTFAGPRTIDEIDLFTQQDDYNNPVDPSEQTTFSLYGPTVYEVQYLAGSQWVTVPGGSVSGNNKVWRKFTFPAVVTTKVRVHITASADGYSRVFELEAWGWEGRSNVALASNGGVASASSSYNSPPFVFTPAGANEGDRRGANWGSGGGWNDTTGGAFPDWLQIDFAGSKTIDEVDVFTNQDAYYSPAEPSEALTFTQYGLTEYEVQYWDGANWVTVQGGSVSGNNRVWRKFTFPAVTTSRIRVLMHASADGYSRLAEVEAWGVGAGGTSQGADVWWLVTDQLGTPRMVVDKTGSLAGVSRHDYLPFGEELLAGTGGRATTQGYGAADNVRQKFTKYERDGETGLDYAQARYYASAQGRFSSVDPLLTSGKAEQPQSWNRYSYTINNPLKFVDPSGLIWGYYAGNDRKTHYHWYKDQKELEASGAKNVEANGGLGSFIYKSERGDWIRLDADSAKWRSFSSGTAAFYGREFEADNSSAAGQALGLSLNLTAGKAISAGASKLLGFFFRGAGTAAGEVAASAGETAGSGTFRFTQTTASPLFSSEGSFAGRSIGEVAADLRSGVLSPSEVPVGVVSGADGLNLIVNTRSSLSLMRGGVPQNSWTVVDLSANQTVRAQIQARLFSNGLTNQGTEVLRITRHPLGKAASNLR